MARHVAAGSGPKLRSAGSGFGRNETGKWRKSPMSSTQTTLNPRLTLKTEGDTHIVVTRRFNAKPDVVYRAHTDPQIIQKWLLGPDGWTMPVCISDARPQGKIRYEWSNAQGHSFYITGE